MMMSYDDLLDLAGKDGGRLDAFSLDPLMTAIVPGHADGCAIHLFPAALPARDGSEASSPEEVPAGQSAIRIPLRVEGQEVGALLAVMGSSGRAFNQMELAKFRDVGDQLEATLRGPRLEALRPMSLARGERLVCSSRGGALFGSDDSDGPPRPPLPLDVGGDEFRSLVDHAPDIILRFDRELNCIYVNRAIETLGVSPSRFMTDEVHDIVAGKLKEAVWEAIDVGRSSTIECTLGRNDGSSGIFECRVAPEAPGTGATAVAIVRDVTQQKFTEDRLRYQATLLDAVGEAVAAVDLEGRIVYWNRQAEILHQWKAEEVFGRNAVELLVPRKHRRYAAEVLKEVAAGKARAEESTLRRKDRTVFRSLSTVAPVWDERGQMIGIVTAWTDLTRRVQLEEQLRQAQKMEAVGRLAGGVAHDFNNLLTSIAGYNDLVLSELREDDPARQFAREVRDAAERAANLTRQLLAFSRKQLLQPRVIEPRQIIRGMQKLLRSVIGEDVELVLTSDGPATVLADPTQIEQVILNLAVNARDAMPLGGTLTISVESRSLEQRVLADQTDLPPGRYVVISVRDTGTGIPADVKPHIFEPFFTTKSQEKGTGLGLATVYGILHQSGGGIVLDSVPGEGTIFSVYLPRIEETSREPEEPEEVSASTHDGGRTILVVEDEDSVRLLVSKILARLGYRVLQADDGLEGLRVFQECAESIDLVLTDVIMPRMRGSDLAVRLKEDHPELPVLFMSGYTDDVLAGHDIVEPGVNLLEKPFTAEQLARHVQEALTHKMET